MAGRLHKAVSAGDTAAVQALLGQGCDVNEMFGSRGTPLCAAISAQQPQIVQLLLEAGCNSDLADTDGEPPLFLAVRKQYMDIVQLLLEHSNHSIDRWDPVSGNTPLLSAITNGNLELVKLLLQHGCNPDKPCMSHSVTPINLAVKMNRKDIVEALISGGCALDAHHQSGELPIHVAAGLESPEMLRFILSFIPARLQHDPDAEDSIDSSSDEEAEEEAKGENKLPKDISADLGYTYSLRYRGNFFYKEKQYMQADSMYQRALRLIERLRASHIKTDEPTPDMDKFWQDLDHQEAQLLCSQAQCHLQVDNFQEALELTNQVLQKTPDHAKALFVRSKAYAGLGRYDEAKADYHRVVALKPSLAETYALCLRHTDGKSSLPDDKQTEDDQKVDTKSKTANKVVEEMQFSHDQIQMEVTHVPPSQVEILPVPSGQLAGSGDALCQPDAKTNSDNKTPGLVNGGLQESQACESIKSQFMIGRGDGNNNDRKEISSLSDIARTSGDNASYKGPDNAKSDSVYTGPSSGSGETATQSNSSSTISHTVPCVNHAYTNDEKPDSTNVPDTVSSENQPCDNSVPNSSSSTLQDASLSQGAANHIENPDTSASTNHSNSVSPQENARCSTEGQSAPEVTGSDVSSESSDEDDFWDTSGPEDFSDDDLMSEEEEDLFQARKKTDEGSDEREYEWTDSIKLIQAGYQHSNLAVGWTVNVPNTVEQCNALHIATKAERIENVRCLLEHGCELNLKDRDGKTALVLACERGNVELASLLLDAGADPNVKGCSWFLGFKFPEASNVAIYSAVKNDLPHLVDKLVQHGADLNVTVCDDGPLLHYCFNRDKLEMAEKLLDYAPEKMDVTRKDRYKHSCLFPMCKCELSNPQLVERVIKLGCSVNDRNCDGEYPVESCVSLGRPDLLEVLLKNGAYINKPDHDGCTALHIAVMNEDYESVDLLMRYGADMRIGPSKRDTIITIAFEYYAIDFADQFVLEGYNAQKDCLRLLKRIKAGRYVADCFCEDKKLIKRFAKLALQPLSLCHLCRNVIREYFIDHELPYGDIMKIPGPQKILEYVMMKENIWNR